jgi:ribonuclease MRP protein subunit RMP1
MVPTTPSKPNITAAALLNISPTDKQALLDIHELLTRLYVRNRNQHRRSHWFRPLGMFRRQLGLLLGEMDDGKGPGMARGIATGSAVRLKGVGMEEMLEKRLGYWDKVVHEWYL